MSKFMQRLERKSFRKLLMIIFLIPLIPIVFNVIYLNLYSGLNTSLRIWMSILLIFATLSFITFGFYCIKSRSRIKTMICLITTLVLSIGATYSAYVNYRVYDTLLNVTNQTTLTNYELVTLATKPFETYDDLEGVKIGIINVNNIQVREEIDNFFDSHQLLGEVEFITYPTPFELITDLYAEELDAVVIGEDFEELFVDLIGYETIETDLRLLAEINMSHIEADPESSKQYVSLTEEPFSMLLIGVDSAEFDISASSLADTIILATVNPKTLSITLTSIPRDTYTPIACFDMQSDKITHANNGGTQCVIDTVAHMFDIDIPYYAKINFKGFVELIDAMGGITVDVPYSFSEQNSDREFGDSLIYVEKGLQTLDGEQALALARHRKTLPSGDLGRAESQQLVINAAISSLLSEVGSITELLGIIDVLNQNVDTNFSIEQITSSFEYVLDVLSSYGGVNPMNYIHLSNQVLAGDSGYLYSPLYGIQLSFVFPYESAVLAAKNLMHVNLELIEPTIPTEFTFNPFEEIEEESYGGDYYMGEGEIIPPTDDLPDESETEDVLPNFIGRNWTPESIISWGQANGISVTVDYIVVGEPEYDPSRAGQVVSQSVSANTNLMYVTQITIQVMGQLAVPDFNAQGATQAQIQSWATETGVRVSFLGEAYSDTVAAGKWIMNVTPGSPLDLSQTITFTLSKGPQTPEPTQPTCQDGETLVDGVCQPITPQPPVCQDGEQLIDGVCQPIVPNPPVCQDNEELIDGVCRPIAPQPPVCEEDEELIDGVCQPKELGNNE